MSIISECLRQILSARYGRDVRQAIHDGIQQCYYDGKAGSIDLEARQEIEALKDAKDTTETTETTMPNSYSGRLKVEEIGGGESQQDTTSGKQLAQDAVVGTATGIYNTALFVKADFKPNTQYTFSFKGAVGNRYYVNEYMFVNDISFTVVDGINTFTVTTKGDISEQLYSNGYLILKNHKDQSNQNKFEEVMVVEGATSLPYEPYTGGIPAPNPSYPQEIKKTVVSEVKTHGKNLLDCRGLTAQTTNGVTFTPVKDADGNLLYVEVNGTAKANTDYYLVSSTIWYGASGEYILSGCPGGGSQDKTYVLYTYNGRGYPMDEGNGKAVFQLQNGAPYFVFIRIYSGYTANNIKFYPMIRSAEIEDDTYEPHTESAITLSQPIILNGIGDVMDYIDVERGKVVRRFAEYDLSTLVQYYTSNRNGWYALLNELKPLAKCLFEKYKYSETAWYSDNYAGVDKDRTFWCKNNDSANKATGCMIAELATPTEEALPIADQIALNSLATYDGITYLEFDSEIEPTFKGEYGTSKVGGCTLEGAMKANTNALMLNGDSFEFAEHGLTFKGLKVGKMVTVQVSGALDYGITDENKVKTFASVIPEGFRPIATTHIGCFSVSSKDGNGNRLTNMFDLGVGGSGAIQFQVELKNSEGQSITTSSTGMPLNMAISYISE